jgi:nitrite reductase/ring-hydroxylating ferredoxin subunit
MATLLDVAGGRGARRAADVLVATGALAAVPTAAAGLNDWSDTYGPETRVGLVHAVANTTALGLYTASLAARLRSRRGRAKLLGMAGFATLVAGGYLGGYLSFVLGVNVNHTAWEYGPGDWTAVLAETDLADGQACRVQAGGAGVLLHRDGDRIHALDAVCSHAGGPLEEGTIAEGCVTCPWHGSTFRLADGRVERGPASIPQPAYDTRVSGGKIEVRARG